MEGTQSHVPSTKSSPKQHVGSAIQSKTETVHSEQQSIKKNASMGSTNNSSFQQNVEIKIGAKKRQYPSTDSQKCSAGLKNRNKDNQVVYFQSTRSKPVCGKKKVLGDSNRDLKAHSSSSNHPKQMLCPQKTRDENYGLSSMAGETNVTSKASYSSTTSSEKKWHHRYQELVDLKELHGHCNVPNTQEEKKQLAAWVSNQRYQYKKMREGKRSQITTERVQLLEKIGFEWSCGEMLHDLWQQRYEELMKFKNQNGHCNVPQGYKQNNQLAVWVSNQRVFYNKMREGKRSCITSERVGALEKIGFEWSPCDKLQDLWQKRYQQLVEFQELNGHCNVPHTLKEKKLAGWVSNQRYQRKKMLKGERCSITSERVKALEKIDFDWSPDQKQHDLWKQRYNELIEFKEHNGHCNVPHAHKENKQLAVWVSNQRVSYNKVREGKKCSMSADRIEALEKIGFEWSPDLKLHDLWQQRYKELIEFKELNGHCNVPQRSQENKQLAAWVNAQRTQYKKKSEGKKSSITLERIELLEKIDFQWSMKPANP